MKFRKKPVIIEAIKFNGYNWRECYQFMDNKIANFDEPGFAIQETLTIDTLEGKMIASIGDWIIRGVNGEYYPCKPDIFDKTYEEV